MQHATGKLCLSQLGSTQHCVKGTLVRFQAKYCAKIIRNCWCCSNLCLQSLYVCVWNVSGQVLNLLARPTISFSTGLCSNIMWDRGTTGKASVPRQAKTSITWQRVGLIPSGTPANNQRRSIPYVPNSVFGLCVFEHQHDCNGFRNTWNWFPSFLRNDILSTITNLFNFEI